SRSPVAGRSTDRPANRSARLPDCPSVLPATGDRLIWLHVPQMPRVLVQNQFRLDSRVCDSDQTDAEVVAPAAIGGGAGIEEEGLALALDEGDVAVPVDDAVDPAGEAARLASRRLSAVAVQHREPVATDPKLDRFRDQLAELGIVVVAGDGEDG